MGVVKKNIPNLVTCLNLLGGCLAVICALKGSEPFWGGLAAYQWAFIFMGASAVADFLDGFVARLLHQYSELGKQLDSLCDLVSFGVAPGMLLLKCLQTAPFVPGWLAWISLAIPVAAALRLARFNIDDRQTTSFIGLPVPANAIFWIGFTASAYGNFGFLPPAWLTAAIILIECWLMLSPLEIFSLKMRSYGWNGNAARWILIAAAVALIAFMGLPGLMWLIVVYVCLSQIPAFRK